MQLTNFVLVLTFSEIFTEVCRAVASGGAAVFGWAVNPISTRGADYAHHSTTSPPPRIFRPCDGPLFWSHFNSVVVSIFDPSFQFHFPVSTLTSQTNSSFRHFSSLDFLKIILSFNEFFLYFVFLLSRFPFIKRKLLIQITEPFKNWGYGLACPRSSLVVKLSRVDFADFWFIGKSLRLSFEIANLTRNSWFSDRKYFKIITLHDWEDIINNKAKYWQMAFRSVPSSNQPIFGIPGAKLEDSPCTVRVLLFIPMISELFSFKEKSRGRSLACRNDNKRATWR